MRKMMILRVPISHERITQMRTTIDADCILANLLLFREAVTLGQLNDVRVKIEQRFPDVYVDVTQECLVWAANEYPEMFALSYGMVRKVKPWTRDYVEEFFNWRIPAEIRAGVLEALASS
jgi:hypothetical protein